MPQRRKAVYSTRLISSICLLIALFLTLVGASFAWLMDLSVLKPNENFSASSISAYFYSGDGLTRETAYVITEPVHLYNLAWLQYLGVFNETDDQGNILHQYYFRLDRDIDMDGLILPPIGTTEHPFVGNFNGNGKMITNATVSNYLSDTEGDGGIEQAPASVKTYDNTLEVNDLTEQGAIVGFFGVVGDWAGNIKGLAVEDTSNQDIMQKVNAVYNFFLNDLTVRSDTQESLMGLLAGYVTGSMENVGIGTSRLQLGENVTALNIADSPFEMQQLVSKYSLIGLYDESRVNWVDKPTQSGDGNGDGDTPGGAGGEIIVDPNNMTLTTSTNKNDRVQYDDNHELGTDDYQAVTNTIPGTAYYSGALASKSRPNGSMSIWDLTSGSQESFTADTPEKQQILLIPIS